jgi:hypothetical protein
MNLLYLHRGREELSLAREFLKDLTDDTVFQVINHLTKGMDFIVDFLNNEHVELALNLNILRSLIIKVVGEEFIETYFYLNSLKSKTIRVLNNSNILISGKSVAHVTKEHFEELTLKVVRYFNKVYDKTESGKIWA